MYPDPFRDLDRPESTECQACAPSSPHLLLTIDQAAERLNVGRTLMYALISSNVVESVLVGRLRRVPPDALKTYVDGLRAVRPDRAA